MKRTALPKQDLTPRRNVEELPISPCTSLETSGPSSTSSSLLSLNSFSASSTFSPSFHRFCCTNLWFKSNRDRFLCDFALPLIHKLRKCPMLSHGGLLAYSALSYSGIVEGCSVPERNANSGAHIDVCERFHEWKLRQQQCSLRFGMP